MYNPNSRRRFLQTLGLGGAASMLPSASWQPHAKAQDGATPKRVIYFTTQHGAPARHWKMNPGGLPANSDGFVDLAGMPRSEFSHVFDPLYDVRDKVSILDGMAMVSSMLDPQGNNHGVAWAHLLTNNPANYDSPFIGGAGNIHPYPTALSVDQYIASRITQPAGSLPSVVWGTGGRFGESHAFSTGADGSWIPQERNPGNAFGRLMGLLPTDVEPRPPTRRELIQAQRSSVLDVAAGEYERLIPRLSEADRNRLDLHRQQIRDLENRLQPRVGGGPMCSTNFDASGQTMDQFFRLATLALSCDVTRVIALNVGELAATDFGAPSGSDVHQDWAHGTSDEAHMHMGNYYRTHSQQFAQLLGHLDSVPDSDGGTLLDHTMVVWMTELANGGHDFHDCMTVVAGGANRGRYIRYAQNRTRVCDHYGCNSPGIGPGHQHLLISSMQHMGLPDTTLNAATGQALDGSTVDLSGPLEFV